MRYMLVLLLAGCAGLTPAERAERDLAEFGPYCDRMGFANGSDSWRNCIVQSASAADADATARAGVAAQNVRNTQGAMRKR